MTHLEPFTCPVWDVEQMKVFCADRAEYMERSKDVAMQTYTYVLFDYKRRDPLTGSALTQLVEKEQADV